MDGSDPGRPGTDQPGAGLPGAAQSGPGQSGAGRTGAGRSGAGRFGAGWFGAGRFGYDGTQPPPPPPLFPDALAGLVTGERYEAKAAPPVVPPPPMPVPQPGPAYVPPTRRAAALFPHMTVRHNIAFGLAVRKVARAEQA
ncbi:hypothetical protein AB0H25_17780, partial [Actinosynnema sp. NPDC023926]